MADRACGCETDRLRRHVEGRLGEDEQELLAAHLDRCEECRCSLEALAGDDGLWRDLRFFLVGELDLSTPKHGPADNDSTEGRGRPDVHDDWEGWKAVLAFLDPPADQGHIGSFGPYQIVEVIGRGGMGLVLKGVDPALGRVVAIKVLAPELSYLGSARLRFAREARAAAAVAHEHVVAIHAVDSWKGLPYLVMQYIADKSLQGGSRATARSPSAKCSGSACRWPRAWRPHTRRARAPRHQAREYPAGERHRAGQDHRLRSRSAADDASLTPERRGCRDAAVHGARAGPVRADRPPSRPLRPRRRDVRHVYRTPAVPGRDRDGGPPSRL